MTAEEAVRLLRDGNRRFMEGKVEIQTLDPQRRKDLVRNGQKPFACVLSCSDSRVPSEHVFNLGFGQLFIVRVAGNVCHALEIGSVEFAVRELAVPLIFVLGHTGCSAVTAAVENHPLTGPSRLITDRILPSVYLARQESAGATEEVLIDRAVQLNVFKSMEDLLLGSDTIRDAVRLGHTKVKGGVYDMESGEVRWLGPHPKQGQWLEL